jgi:hypothetical protein
MLSSYFGDEFFQDIVDFGNISAFNYVDEIHECCTKKYD